MARAKIAASKGLVAKRKKPSRIERILLISVLATQVVILLKLYGVI